MHHLDTPYRRHALVPFPSMCAVLSASEIDRLLAGGRNYRSKVVVRAVRVTGSSEWTTARGDVLEAKPNDWWIIDGERRWSVAERIFADTYQNIGGDRYRKVALVTAVVVDRTFAVRTCEGVATGESGDWLVRNPSGECWPVTADVFERRYEEA